MYPIGNRITETRDGKIFVVKKAMTLKRGTALLYLKIYIEILEGSEGGSFSFLSNGLHAPDGICHPEEF